MLRRGALPSGLQQMSQPVPCDQCGVGIGFLRGEIGNLVQLVRTHSEVAQGQRCVQRMGKAVQRGAGAVAVKDVRDLGQLFRRGMRVVADGVPSWVRFSAPPNV